MTTSLALADVADRWPVATSVGAYLATGFPPGPVIGAPPSGLSATASGTVDSGGDLAITGLAYSTAYRLGASVSGAWKWLTFTTGVDPATEDVTQGQLDLKAPAWSGLVCGPPLGVSASAAATTSNEIAVVRVLVPKSGQLRDVSVIIGTSSGNMIASVYSTEATRARLATSGSVACPSGGGWAIVFDPNIAVVEGDTLDLAVSVDNTTATLGRVNGGMATGAHLLPTGFIPGDGALAKQFAKVSPGSFTHPATIAEASLAATTTVFPIIARVS